MDRINKIGRTLIGYKTELLKHYSPIVDESLIIALENQMEKKVLNQEYFDLIINDSVPIEEFEKYILNKREYLKSPKELLEEFEKVRETVNNSLIRMSFTNFVETESNVNSNKISILRQYTISEDFIKIYFGLEDKDMEQIMKKKGFAEKFAVLRLTKVFKEIFAEMRPETEYSQGFSKVYYNNDVNGFSIDYKYHLNVDIISEHTIDMRIKKIKDADRVVERKFLKKTGMSFYNIEPIKTTISETLNVSKNNPNNKSKETEIKDEEIKEIKEQIKVEDVKDESLKKSTISEKQIENSKNVKIRSNQSNKISNIQEPKEKEIKNNINNYKPKENSKIKEDFLDIDTEDEQEVIKVIEEVANMNIEEDLSGEFLEDDFTGIIPDGEESDDDVLLEDVLIDDSIFENIPPTMDDIDDI